jgi:hypothetical protein
MIRMLVALLVLSASPALACQAEFCAPMGAEIMRYFVPPGAPPGFKPFYTAVMPVDTVQHCHESLRILWKQHPEWAKMRPLPFKCVERIPVYSDR